MTSRKPPSQRDPQYAIVRYGRALQSMSPGSMGGRVANASPVSFRSAAAAPLVTAPSGGGGGGVGRPADKGTPGVVIDYPDATPFNVNYLEGNHATLIGDGTNAAASYSFIFGNGCQVGFKGDYDISHTVDDIYVFADGATIGCGIDPEYFVTTNFNDPIYPVPNNIGPFDTPVVPIGFQRFGRQSDMIVMGDAPTVDGRDIIIMGDGPRAFGYDIICMGDGPVAGGNRFVSENWHGYIPADIITIGDAPKGYGYDAIAIGDGPSAGSQRRTRDPDAGASSGPTVSYDNVAIGNSASAGSPYFNFNYDDHIDGGGSENVAVGGGSNAGQNQAYHWATDGNTALGEWTGASGEGLQGDYRAGYATALGWDAYVLANGAVGVGKDPFVGQGGTRAVVVGSESFTASSDVTVVGPNAAGGNTVPPVNDDDSPVTDTLIRAADVRHSTALGAQSVVLNPYRIKLGTEIDSVEIPRQFVMTSPNNSKWVLSVDNTGAITSAPLVPYTVLDTFHKRDHQTVPTSYSPFSVNFIGTLEGFKGLGTANPTMKLLGSEAGPVWADAFGATLEDKWEIVHGKVRRYDHEVDAGTAVAYLNYGITRPHLAHTGPDQHVGIYVLPSDVYGRAQGLYFRLSSDGLNGYLATIYGDYLRLFSVAGAVPTQLAQVQVDLPGSGMNDGAVVLECVANGTTIQVLINGIKYIDVTDATYATGNHVGLFSAKEVSNTDSWKADAGFFDMLMDMSSGNVFPADYSGRYGGSEAPSLYKIFRRAQLTFLDDSDGVTMTLNGRSYGHGSNMTDNFADVTWRYFQNGTLVITNSNSANIMQPVLIEWFSSATGAWNDPGGVTLVASHTESLAYNNGNPTYYNVQVPLSGPNTNGVGGHPALVRVTNVESSTIMQEIRWSAYT